MALADALAPQAHDFAAGVEPARNGVITEALGGQQDHPGACDSQVRQRIAGGAGMEFSTLLLGQINGNRARQWREALSATSPLPRPARSRKSLYVRESMKLGTK